MNDKQCSLEDSSSSIALSTTILTPVSRCCLKKKCYDKVSPKVQNDLFNGFWRIGDYAKQNYFLVGLMAAQSPKQTISEPIKKNKSFSWKYWVDIRGRKLSVCKGFFLAVYGVTDKRLRVLQTKLVNGDPLEDQRGRYDKHKRANQHTVNKRRDIAIDGNTAEKQLKTVASDHSIAANNNILIFEDFALYSELKTINTVKENSPSSA